MKIIKKEFLLPFVFFGVPFFILKIYLNTHDFIEKKYATWDAAYADGVFQNERLPSNVPKSATNILLSHDDKNITTWGAFSIPKRSEIQKLLIAFKRIDREKFRKLNFPHPSGFPWGGNAPTLADLESYDGRKEKVEYYVGSCEGQAGQAILVFNGYGNTVYYGCELTTGKDVKQKGGRVNLPQFNGHF